MNIRGRGLLTAGLLAFVFVATNLFAGGPIAVGGSGIGIDGQAFVWDNSQPIQYRTDGGPLGALSNSSANSMVAQAFQQWSQIPTAKISFSRTGSILGVSDGDVNTISELNTVFGACSSGTQTPIIYDNDGSLLLQLTGDTGVVGLSGPCSLTSSGKIQAAFSILGNPSFLPANFVPAVMVHEFGHFIGLDHSEIGSPFSTGSTQADVDGLPTMYWQLITPMQNTPEADDKAWVSQLYPSSSFTSSYGLITGHVYFSDGNHAVQDVLVVARALSDIHRLVVSSISGFRFTGNPGQPFTADYMPCSPATACGNGTLSDNTLGSQFGSRDPSLIGTYEIPVPPGQYIVEVRPITGGSIGPVDPFLPMPGSVEYWDMNESANDGDVFTGSSTPISVNAGQTVTNINIILNGTDPPFDIFEKPQANIFASPLNDPNRAVWAALLPPRVTKQ